MIDGWTRTGFPVTRTKPLMASQLVKALNCPLRYLLDTGEAQSTSLPKPLSALLGIAVHNVCQRGAVGVEREISAASVRGRVGSELEKLVSEETSARLILEALKLRACPENLLPQSDFLAKVSIAYRSLQTRQSYSSKGLRPALGADKARRFGFEVPLASVKFDLVGRADRIELLPDRTVRIIDYKTGSDRSVRVDVTKSEIWIQVAAYGLMAQELDPNCKIVLRLIFPENVYDRVYSTELEAELISCLRSINGNMPRGLHVNSEELAAPGRLCRTCRHRHLCNAYKEFAEQRWESNDTVDLPRDVWGTVADVSPQTDYLSEIRLIDPKLRRVRIRNVPNMLMPGKMRKGSGLKAFALASTESGRGSKYPQNFYIADVDRPQYSAFSAALLEN